MGLRLFHDAEELCRAAADEFIQNANAAIEQRGRFTVVLSGGSTPRRLFEHLSGSPLRDLLDWSAVEVVWGDERAVPPSHSDSNFRMANETLLCRLKVPEARIHRLQAEREALAGAASDYQVEIARVCNVDPGAEPPSFDLVLLGLGSDGHTASLFPETEALSESRDWVVPNYVPKLSAHRLTLTPRILNRASHILVLVAGPDKAVALADVLEGTYEPKRLPAQLIRPEVGKLSWFVDEPAAARLEKRGA